MPSGKHTERDMIAALSTAMDLLGMSGNEANSIAMNSMGIAYSALPTGSGMKTVSASQSPKLDDILSGQAPANEVNIALALFEGIGEAPHTQPVNSVKWTELLAAARNALKEPEPRIDGGLGARPKKLPSPTL